MSYIVGSKGTPLRIYWHAFKHIFLVRDGRAFFHRASAYDSEGWIYGGELI